MVYTEQHPLLELPFFVNGSLQGNARLEIESHLKECAMCQKEVQTLKAIRQKVKNNITGDGPGEMGWQRLKNQIQNEKHQTKQKTVYVWQAVAAAAVLAVAIQSALLYKSESLTEGYQTLGVADSSLQVSFYPTVTEAQIREVLNEIDARIVDGPGALGIYRITLVGVTENKNITEHRAKVQAKLASYSDWVRYVSE